MADNPDPPATPAASCPCCGEPATRICSECRDVAYCSTECQKKDWKFHKQLCESVKDFRKRPAVNMRRVVCFPANGDGPEFRWMEVRDYESDGFQDVKTSGTGLADASHPMSCAINVRTKRLLPELIVFQYDDNFVMNYRMANSALFAATSACLGFNWKGPIIAYSGASVGGRSISEIQDFSMGQYSALMAFFVAYTSESKGRLMRLYQDLTEPEVKAVYIVLGRSGDAGNMRSVDIDLRARFGSPGSKEYHYDCDAGSLSAISQRIGMPVTAWKCSAQQLDQNEEKNNDIQSGVCCFRSMFIIMEEDAAMFGNVSTKWNKVDMHLLLVRCGEEAHDMELDTAAAFLAYCQYHVGSFVEWALEVERAGRLPRIQRVLEEVTPVKWASYQLQYQKMLDKSGEVSKEAVGDSLRMGLTEEDKGKVVARFIDVQLPDLVPLAFD